jgi:uncharacterized protein (DUF952 family)
MIYHIATQKEWADAKEKGCYAPAAYATENFIHACKPEQIEGVLLRHFYNATGLIILHIDERFLTAPHTFVFVNAVNEEFPHIFGTINLDAVTSTTIIEDLP